MSFDPPTYEKMATDPQSRVLKAGAFADVIAFDPATFAPRADYAHPALFSTGMRFVLVNGVLAIENGEPTGAAGGTPLPRTPKRSEEHTSELQSIMRITYAVFCLTKKNK